MKILIITSSFDLTTDYFIEKYKDKAVFFRFNTDLFPNYLIEIDELLGWRIKCKQWMIDQKSLDAVYYRKPSFPDMGGYELKYHRMMQKDLLTVIQGLVETFNGRCLSKPSLLNLAENKVYQLSIAKEVGFNIPKTLISNSSDAANSFCSSVKSVVKPLSLGKVYAEEKVGIVQTNLVEECFKFNGLEISPSYFQEYIWKEYEVRVTIINDNVFAVRIDSTDKVDWRKRNSQNSYSNIDLPEMIKYRCTQMMDRLNLKFGAFDFIVNNNNYYFLEVNPNGQWYWLEEALDLDISECIFDYLAGAE